MTAPARTWLYAVVGVLLAAIGGGTWMMTRQQEIPALGSQSVAPLPAVAAPAAAIQAVPAPASATAVTAGSGDAEPGGRRRPAPSRHRSPRPARQGRGRRVVERGRAVQQTEADWRTPSHARPRPPGNGSHRRREGKARDGAGNPFAD